MNIEKLMSAHVYCCSPSDTLHYAAQLMRDHDVGICPVVDDGNHLVGVITDRDISLAPLDRPARLDQIKVREAMTADPVSCARGDSLVMAEGLMSRYQVRRLPVVDAAKHVVGLISLHDLALAQSGRHDWPGLRPEAIARTLGSICRPATSLSAMAK